MDIQNVINLLAISKGRLDDELEIQAEMQWRISEEVNRRGSALGAAKDHLDVVEARLSKKYEDLSVAKCSAAVKTEPARIDAFEAMQTARQEYERWQSVYSAWQSRGYSIKTLADLYAHDYFALNSAGSRQSRSREDVTEARARLTEDRNSRREARDSSPEPRKPVVSRRGL